MARWHAILDRIVAENTALMQKHGIAHKAGKNAKPGSKGDMQRWPAAVNLHQTMPFPKRAKVIVFPYFQNFS